MHVTQLRATEPRPPLTSEDVASRFNVTIYTVRRWIHEGALKATLNNRRWEITPEDLDAFVAASTVKRTVAPPPRKLSFEDEVRHYTLREVAAMTGTPLWRIQRAVHEGKVDYQRPGKAPMMIPRQIVELVAYFGHSTTEEPDNELAAERAKFAASLNRQTRKAS